MTARHLAGHATYPGDVTSIVGEVKGATTFGTFLVAATAAHNADTDRTRVEFRVLTDADDPHIHSDRARRAFVLDEAAR